MPASGAFLCVVCDALECAANGGAFHCVRESQSGVVAAALQGGRRGDRELTYRFWQRGGGYDRNLRSAKDVYEKIAYNHDNPVRRGLVARSEDWPSSSAREWITREPGPVPIDWAVAPEPEL